MNNIEQAVTVFNQGGIVIFPTDTAFGIGCRIDRRESVRKLFTLRKRAENKAMPVLVGSPEMAAKYYYDVSDTVASLMKEYWPGALTIVYFANNETVPELVRGGGPTVGLRMPNHLPLLDIITHLGVPILGPSANFSGKETPYSQSDLDPELTKLVDYILPGEVELKQASTVVDATTTPIKILRQGAVSL